jgi:hypothetical protein
MTACPENHELSLLLVDPGEASEIAAHVGGCAACQERRDKLARLLTLEPTAEPPAHVLPELLRRIDEQVPEGSMEPVAFLGGAIAEPETLPALPPAGVSAVYSASDFIAAPAEEPEPEPVAVTTPDESDFESYAEHPAETAEPVAAVDLPKTISQREAEDIIQRITTKKILPDPLPLERAEPPELTRRRGPRLGLAAAMLALAFGSMAATVYFKDDVGPYLPELIQNLIGYVPPPIVAAVEPIGSDTPEMKKEKAFRAKVLESEWRAFGYASLQEMLDANKPDTTKLDVKKDGEKK